jgi:hypothetical protein
MSDKLFEVDADGTNGGPDEVAAVLESIAEALRKSPEGCRYDFEVTVDEVHTPDGVTDE